MGDIPKIVSGRDMRTHVDEEGEGVKKFADVLMILKYWREKLEALHS